MNAVIYEVPSTKPRVEDASHKTQQSIAKLRPARDSVPCLTWQWPGQPLAAFVSVEVAEKLGMSRTPVQEALVRPQQENLGTGFFGVGCSGIAAAVAVAVQGEATSLMLCIRRGLGRGQPASRHAGPAQTQAPMTKR